MNSSFRKFSNKSMMQFNFSLNFKFVQITNSYKFLSDLSAVHIKPLPYFIFVGVTKKSYST